MVLESEESLLQVLHAILAGRGKNLEQVKRFQAMVWDGPLRGIDQARADVFRDLAYDLSFFEPDPGKRAESPSYYGTERLRAEVSEALARLKNLPMPAD